MQPREKLYNRVSEELHQPVELVETVVSWAYKSANQASKQHNELEISGLGTAFISNRKLKKRISELERMIPLMEKKNNPKLQSAIDYLNELKRKDGQF